jgi:S-adenosylmethionine:tRNA ribosyltransferase-isomerase
VTDLWTKDFDFELPEDRIALRPAEPRDAARLLVVGTDGRLVHTKINRLPEYLYGPDRLILNDSRVIAARLLGRRAARVDGGANTTPAVEIMLHKRLTRDGYLAYARPARKLVAGDRLELGHTLNAWVVARGARGEVELRFDRQGAELDAAIEAEGEIPLPPYIAGKRKADARDREDYQTIYAADPGSVAAPTAGLHFTPQLLSALAQRGVGHETVTLHVGAGTFLPVHAEDTRDHIMHAESATLTADAAGRLNAARAAGGRLVAVGTTSLRTLESAADEQGTLAPMAAATDIFITPGYRFRAVDVLLTNFHLPRSTLFMLVCAFCGVDRMRMAYEEAIRSGYRFYSYGDACLLFRASP